MRTRDWLFLTAALIAVPAAFCGVAFTDAIYELGIFHSTWKSGVALFGFVSIGLFLLWRLTSVARWKRALVMVIYAPAMFMLIASLGVAIQFAFDDCMS